MKVLQFIILFAICVFSVGCANPYYVIESEYIATDSREQPAEATHIGRATLNKQIIAVKAPDHCINETEAQTTGEADASARIMQTSCGVEMANIERAVAKAGYGVISWKILQNALDVANRQDITELTAAKQLGAGALLQINSLERSVSPAGREARWDRRYYKSDKRGTKKESVSVKVDKARDFNRLIQNKEAKEEQHASNRLSATINASATLLENGQTFWFYNWNHFERLADNQVRVGVHVKCEGQGCFEFQQAKAKPVEQLYSGNSRAISRAKNPQDDIRFRHDRLMKEVIEDMVAQLNGS